MSDQQVRLRAMLDDLENGRVRLSDAAAQVRTMTFPVKARRTAYQVRRADAIGDYDDMPPAGSFAEVAQEYAGGRLTRQQYEVLYQAYLDAEKL